jgi:hypothetical protein
MPEMKRFVGQHLCEELNESSHFLWRRVGSSISVAAIWTANQGSNSELSGNLSLRKFAEFQSDSRGFLASNLPKSQMAIEYDRGKHLRLFASNVFNHNGCHFHGPSWDSGNGYIITFLHCNAHSGDSARGCARNSLSLRVCIFSGEKGDHLLFNCLLCSQANGSTFFVSVDQYVKRYRLIGDLQD